jgi:hypothetical protein
MDIQIQTDNFGNLGSADKQKNKDAYDGFSKLGFIIPYTRYHYRLK